MRITQDTSSWVGSKGTIFSFTPFPVTPLHQLEFICPSTFKVRPNPKHNPPKVASNKLNKPNRPVLSSPRSSASSLV